MIKAILFDMDGTLLNTLDDLSDSVNAALKALGYPIRDLEHIKKSIGDGVLRLIERVMPPNASDEQVQMALAAFQSHYTRNMDHKTRPYEGIQLLLDRLSAKEIGMAVVTNKYQIAAQTLCEKLFPQIQLTVGDLPPRMPKPSPEGTLYALEALGVKPDEALFVGDSHVDMMTAHRAGIVPVGVLWGFSTQEELIDSGAHHLVKEPLDLLTFI